MNDFFLKNGPLNEVVIGVQFSKPEKYQQIYAGDVWNLFKTKYPKVREVDSLPPSFETFGLPTSSNLHNLNLIGGPVHNRFWFLSNSEEDLIQFQHDRFLHNWRKMNGKNSNYPRFKAMLPEFESELNSLNKYMVGLSGKNLVLNQCEVTYINHIDVTNADEINPKLWCNLFNDNLFEFEDFNISFKEIINFNNKPSGRLTVEIYSAIDNNGRRLILFTLSAKGAPEDNSMRSTVDFINICHEKVIAKFSELITPYAQNKWSGE